MSHARPVALFSVLLLVALLAWPGQADARDRFDAALEHVPAGAEIILAVPNLAAASEAIASFRQATGLPIEELDDVLGELKRELGLGAGIDDDGALLVVFAGVGEAITVGIEPAIMIMVPVTDYAQFVEGLGGDSEAELTPVNLPDAPDAHATRLGDHALLAESHDALQAIDREDLGVELAGLGVAGDRAVETAQAMLYIDIAALAPALRQSLDMLEFQLEMLADEARMMDPQSAVVFDIIDAVGRDLAEMALDGLRSALLSLHVGEAGLSFDQHVGLVADSRLAGFFPGGEAQAKPELDRLPDIPWLIASTIDLTVLDLDGIADVVLELMPDADELPEAVRWIAPLIEPTMQAMRLTRSGAMVLQVPEMMMMMGGGELMRGVQISRVDDVEAFLRLQRELTEAMDGIEMLIADPWQMAAEPRHARMVATYEPDVFQIDGIAVAELTIDYELPEDLDPMLAEMMAAQSSAMYVAAKGERIVTTMTLDRELLRDALAMIDTADGLGTAPALEAAREAGLPPNAFAEGYLSLPGIADLANGFVMMFGMPAIELDPDVQPATFGAAIEQGVVTQRLHVPSNAIRAVVEYFEAMDAMGPQPMPHDDGPPPPPF